MDKTAEDVLEERVEKADLSHMTTAELLLRRNFVTQVVQEAKDAGDGRWRKILPQQRALNMELSRRADAGDPSAVSGPGPDAVVVGLRPVSVNFSRKPAGRGVVPMIGSVTTQTGRIEFECPCGKTVAVDIDGGPGRSICQCGKSYTVHMMLSVGEHAIGG